MRMMAPKRDEAKAKKPQIPVGNFKLPAWIVPQGSVATLTRPPVHVLEIQNPTMPLALQNLMEKPPQTDAAALAKAAGSHEIDCYVSKNGQFPGGQALSDQKDYALVKMKLSEALERISDRSAGSKNPKHKPVLAASEYYYVYQSPDSAYGSLLSEVKGPEGYIKSTSQPAYMRNVWISGQDCVTPPHYDLAENLLVQLEGYKRVIFWPPSQADVLGVQKMGSKFERQAPLHILINSSSNSKKLSEAPCTEVTIGPGDTLYIPPLWIHAVVSLSPLCVSVNYWWNGKNTVPAVAKKRGLMLTGSSSDSNEDKQKETPKEALEFGQKDKNGAKLTLQDGGRIESSNGGSSSYTSVCRDCGSFHPGISFWDDGCPKVCIICKDPGHAGKKCPNEDQYELISGQTRDYWAKKGSSSNSSGMGGMRMPRLMPGPMLVSNSNSNSNRNSNSDRNSNSNSNSNSDFMDSNNDD